MHIVRRPRWRQRSGVPIALAALTVLAVTPAAQAERPDAHAADRDCSDFSSQREAQRYFRSRGGPGSDPDRLDSDGDGRACDSLPCPCGSGSKPKPKRKRARTVRARITKVVDGDTIKVRSLERTGRRRYTVRLIGIDTPETKRPGVAVECGGREASDRMVRLAFPRGSDTNADGLFDKGVGRGRRATLTTDPTQDTYDRYGRLLAYARLRSGTQLQLAQLRAGLAKVYVFGGKPFGLVERFRAASRAARREGRGVFVRCGGDFHRPAGPSAAQPRTRITAMNASARNQASGGTTRLEIAAARACGVFTFRDYSGDRVRVAAQVRRGGISCRRSRRVLKT